jgi:TolB-like protein
MGDIENNSLVKAEYDTDHFCRGLVQVILGDLQNSTPLKVVDRQRLSVLLDELALNKDPARMNEDHRVKLGQLSGAQSYLFGQFMQLDRRRVRLDLRWVDTATGEVLLARGAEGSVASVGDLFKLERKVLVELLAPQIQKMLDGAQPPSQLQKKIDTHLKEKQRAIPPKTSYVKVIEAAGQAMANEDAGDLDAASASWQRVADMNPGDEAARTRARSLNAYRKARKG